MADRLFITFIVLSILFGRAFSQLENEYWKNLSGGLAILYMGGFGTCANLAVIRVGLD